MPASSYLLLPLNQYAPTPTDTTRFAEEAALGMVAPSDPILTQTAEPAALDNLSQIKAVITAMEQAASGQRQTRSKQKRRTLVGLAAPQIGENIRIILVDTRVGTDRKNYGSLQCFLNPEIVWRSRETAEGREGCFSAGPVWGLVRRPIAVKIRALRPDGQPIERIFEGFTARIVQHEIDHLNGIRFPDRIQSDRKRHWVHTEELGEYVKHIRHWPRTCSMEKWNLVKSGGETV
jgi:peptide deformylase